MTTAVRPEIRFKLSPAQKVVFTDPARFRVLIAGRRFGKSYLACLALIQQAVNQAESVAWYIAPTYRQGKEILWTLLKRLTPAAYIAATNETDLSMHLINGSMMAIRGADNPNALRGVGLDLAALDEFAFMGETVWTEAVRPMLSDRQGRALFITTPKGMNWAYDLYLKGQEQVDGFRSWTFTTAEGQNVKPEEIEAARSDLSIREFRQEYEASFETLSGRVYDNFDRAEGQSVERSVHDLGAELLIGMDFNVNPMSCVIGVKAGDELHILESLEVASSNTTEVAQELRRRYPDRRLIIYPDPSGGYRSTKAVAGETDFVILRNHGFIVDASSKAPLVPDRVNAVQAMLKDAKGRRRLKVHPRSHALIRSLDGQTYKKDTSIPDKDSGLDHMADALGYLVWQRFNLLERRHASVQTLHI